MNIILTPQVHQLLMEYITQCPNEISGLGRGHVDPNTQDIIMTDAWIWKQTCTAATTEVVDHGAVFDLASKVMAEGVPMEELCIWWHSHANMAAFFSATDDTTINNWVNNRFLVAVVGNKAGDFKGKVQIKAPLELPLPIKFTLPAVDVPVVIQQDSSRRISPELARQFSNQPVETVIEKLYQELSKKDPAIIERVQNDIAELVSTVTVHTPLPLPNPGYNTKPYEYDDYSTGYDPEPKGLSREDYEFYADACGCLHCEAYLDGTEKRFNRKAHYWGGYVSKYMPIINVNKSI